MAEVVPECPAESFSAGHVPRCQEYRRAYRERNNSLTARVCCCAALPETQTLRAETQGKVAMPEEMVCVWCLCFIQAQPYADVTVFAYALSKDATAEARPVRSWKDAEEYVYGSGLVLRDQNGDRCGLIAHTLVSGDAVCLGHAASMMRARVR